MTLREKLIEFQNQAEAAYEKRKTLGTTLNYVLALALFMISNLFAAIGWPFRYLRSQLRGRSHAPEVHAVGEAGIQLVSERPGLVLLDFWAEWCGPCLMMNPSLETFAAEAPRVYVGKVNADRNQAAVKRFKVRGLPTIILLRDGREVKRYAGPLTLSGLHAFCQEEL